jgi:hypothetical protein
MCPVVSQNPKELCEKNTYLCHKWKLEIFLLEESKDEYKWTQKIMNEENGDTYGNCMIR